VNYEFPYEALDGNRFQRLCQALLVATFPDLQALPLNQGDGGRDAFLRLRQPGETIVFQCKWSQNPAGVKDPTQWLANSLAREAGNIKDLANAGVTRYRVMTNVVGTSRAQKGAIARLQKYMDGIVPISDIQCWWRADIDARLRAHPALRWEFPELLTGIQVLKELMEDALGEDARRRTLAIRSFLADQFDADRSVRFQQIDLEDADLDKVFVDVPLVEDLRVDACRPVSLRDEFD
jgi:hypothetical protein